MSFVHPLVVGFLVALGVGLLVGIDRERNKGDGATRQAGGPAHLHPGLPGWARRRWRSATRSLLAAVALGMVAFAGLSYWRARDGDPGLTTETALVLTTLLGGLAIKQPEFAAGLGVVVAVLLAARSALHRFVRSVLTDDELRDLLIFAAATLVVLPLLPDKPIGPYGALNLRTVWTIVILVMAVSALGYVAVRLRRPALRPAAGGPGLGLRLQQRHHRRHGHAGAARAGIDEARRRRRRAVVGRDRRAARHPDRRHQHADPAGAVAAAGLLGRRRGALWRRLHLVGAEAEDPEARDRRATPSASRTALTFAAILAVVLLVAAAAQDWFGEAGVLVAASAAGFADTHSAAVSVASLVSDGRIKPPQTIIPVLAAFTTNTVTKMVFAVTAGGRIFALYVIPGLLLMLAGSVGRHASSPELVRTAGLRSAARARAGLPSWRSAGRARPWRSWPRCRCGRHRTAG